MIIVILDVFVRFFHYKVVLYHFSVFVIDFAIEINTARVFIPFLGWFRMDISVAIPSLYQSSGVTRHFTYNLPWPSLVRNKNFSSSICKHSLSLCLYTFLKVYKYRILKVK